MSVPSRRGDRGEISPITSLRDEVNRLFDDFFGGLRPVFSRTEWAPALDVSETDKEVVVKAELPGIDPEDVDVSLTGDTLTIKGEKKEEKTEEAENFSRVERRYGSFRRSVVLPTSVDPEKVTASYRNGILRITMEKKEEAKARSIKVKTE